MRVGFEAVRSIVLSMSLDGVSTTAAAAAAAAKAAAPANWSSEKVEREKRRVLST